jgi:hypothetical protein
MFKKLLVIAVALIAFAVIGYLSYNPPNGRPAILDAQQTDINDVAQSRLTLAKSAITATEDLDLPSADRDWSALFTDLPSNRSIALNRALTLALFVDSLADGANNSLRTAEERQESRKQLPTAIERARSAIQDLKAIGGDDVLSLWLTGRVDFREASLLPATLTKSLRKELFERLVSAITGAQGEQPGSVLLGGLLIETVDALEDPIKGLAPEVQEKAASALEVLSKHNGDNLFIALRAARLLIAAKKASATDAVKRTSRLAAAIEPSVRAQTQPIGMTPQQLIENIQGAITAGEWGQAENQMLLWFNVLNGTELVKTDRRRASPHPLDRLSFECVRQFADEVAQSRPTETGATTLEFQSEPAGSESSLEQVINVDFDLDLDVDALARSQDGRLLLLENTGKRQWYSGGSLPVEGKFNGMFVADLFMVDSSDAARLQVKPQSDSQGSDPSNARAATISAARHTSLPTAVLFGDQGVQLVVLDGRKTTEPDKRLQLITSKTGLEVLGKVEAGIAGDLEGDGDLDLVFATGDSGLRVFINRGNRTFFEAADASGGLASLTGISGLAIVDLDRDLDLDVVTTDQSSGQTGILENLLHLQFRHRVLEDIPTVAGAQDVFVGDFDGNVSWDLVVIGTDKTLVAFSQTSSVNAFTIDQTRLIEPTHGTVPPSDFDNDAWSEFITDTNKERIATRLGGNASPALRVQEISPMISATVADYDSDGLLDVMGLVDGKAQVAWNKTINGGHFVDIRFKGIDDNNANSGRVNHYAIGSVVELRFGPNYRSQIITSPVTHFALGKSTDDANIRVIFPNGLTQTIRKPSVDTLVEEEQTLKGSCPYVYACNGDAIQFVTDCLWAAPLGLQVARGVVAKDRPWEYLKIDGNYLSPRNNAYELRITEELWEVAYFDHVSLTAVDHPADVQVWTNEKVGPGDIAKQTLFAFRNQDLRPLQSASDTIGRDVTALLTKADQEYVQGFDRRIRQGLCPPHWIDLDFGDALQTTAEPKSVYLVLTGWILPTDTSLNIQIDQNPELPAVEYPSVWVPDANAHQGWRQAIPFMGFPGGKTKTIVVDVTDVLDFEKPILRIRTSAQIYWDHAELAVSTSRIATITHDLSMLDATLGYHGFSAPVKRSPHSPESYDYQSISQAPKWPPLAGLFTTYGPADELLRQWDDVLVVMGSGDELTIRFTVPETPPPAGWKRDFVLHCVGWDKDADLNTLTGQSADPLPFRAMTSYPPTIDQLEVLKELDEQNRSRRGRTQSFRDFWHR